MTIELNKTNESIVQKMIKNAKSFTAIKSAMLALDMVENAEQAEEYLAERVKRGKRGLSDQMHEYLAGGVRTQSEFYAWLQEHGTENTWKIRKVHDKVRELTNSLHLKYSDVEFEEKLYVESEPVEDEQEAA